MRLQIYKTLTRLFLLFFFLSLAAEAQERNSTVVFRNVTLTDVGMPFIYAGFSLHDELDLLVQAGFMPFEALQTATVNPAKFLDLEKSLSTIEKGKFADLILLDANPLLDISNTRKINSVVANGKLFDRKTLDEMLNNIEAAAKKK